MKNFLTVLGHVLTYALAGYAVYKNPSLAPAIIPSIGVSSTLPSVTTAVKNLVQGDNKQ